MAKRSGGPGKAVARSFLRMLVWLYRRTGGRVGGKMFGAPVLLLTTVGRRTGRPWTVPLMYQTDGDRWVIIASNGGSDRSPGWWLNLRSHPDVSVEIGRESHPVAAVEATGAERERLWQRMAAMYKGYEGYARRTSRRLPVVLLHRR